MGLYLNSKRASLLYQDEVNARFFVDKTIIIAELIPLLEQKEHHLQGGSNKYICITRPRRFGKSVMASMIASYFGKDRDASTIFDGLQVSHKDWYHKHLNQHNVFYIPMNEMPQNCTSYQQYIERIQNKILRDLKQAYADVDIDANDAIWDALNNVLESNAEDTKFIFVLDEWDYIFHRDFVTEQDKESYIDFLNNLLKDQPYVEFSYMTGILPIAKYSSGSELNMFYEYTMINEEKYSNYFGFTESEVDILYDEYLKISEHPRVTREGLRNWYNGYHTKSGERVYNPRSVVAALTNNNLGNYWTSAGPYDEIYYYINHNVSTVRDAIACMISGIPVSAKVSEYAATSMHLKTKDEILSAMVVYGFLSYENGFVKIPNQELMDKFNDMLRKESSLGYVYELAKVSEQMLNATLSQDTETMIKILEFAHNTEIPLLSYNNETDLTALINLVYLAARDFYWVEREDKAGTGYVDFIFYPKSNLAQDGIILELKVNHTADEALQQIKNKQYTLKFNGKLGESCHHTGRILAVGIAYDKDTKKHSCKIEVLQDNSK